MTSVTAAGVDWVSSLEGASDFLSVSCFSVGDVLHLGQIYRFLPTICLARPNTVNGAGPGRFDSKASRPVLETLVRRSVWLAVMRGKKQCPSCFHFVLICVAALALAESCKSLEHGRVTMRLMDDLDYFSNGVLFKPVKCTNNRGKDFELHD